MAVAACSSSSAQDGPTSGPDAKPGFPQPAGTVAVNFSVDDTANKVYTSTQSDGASDLQWKGGMIYDPATRKITSDPTWGGPWAPLYDDGPWTSGGHEPMGSTAGDHKWGITIFVTPPATASQDYPYGLNDNEYQTKYNNGWVWPNSGDKFSVAAGATNPINASGLTFPKFGTTDLQLTIDTSMLAPGTWDTSKVTIKGSAWAWGEQTVTLSNGKGTFTLSAVVGSGKPFDHTGLLNSGDKPEWNWVFNGKEYKDADQNALMTGVTAATKASGASSYSPATVQLYDKAVNGNNGNTYITVP
jgi:hypothetical protein